MGAGASGVSGRQIANSAEIMPEKTTLALALLPLQTGHTTDDDEVILVDEVPETTVARSALLPYVVALFGVATSHKIVVEPRSVVRLMIRI